MDTTQTTAHAPRAVRALAHFFRLEAAGGIVLIAAAAIAMLCANSPLADGYEAFRQLPVAFRFGTFELAKPLLLWINDGLMAIFFLLVALEIKREATSGQLASRDQLVLPLVCAIAGVAVPALLFTALNHDNVGAMRGWAVPTATDIAFALGVLALLGPRVPVGMKLLLSTIAVVDDLIAIVIIALFYSHGMSFVALAWAAVALLGMFMLNRRGVKSLTPYLLLGVVLWVCVLKSGVHATLAGVATGFGTTIAQASTTRSSIRRWRRSSTRCIRGWPTPSCRCSPSSTRASRSAASRSPTWAGHCRWASCSASCSASRSASSAPRC